jgi:hypothetical protein
MFEHEQQSFSFPAKYSHQSINPSNFACAFTHDGSAIMRVHPLIGPGRQRWDCRDDTLLHVCSTHLA